MSKAGGYTLVGMGAILSLFGFVGLLLGIPILFLGAVVVVKRSLDL